jgi:ABC-type amino acid transport substrate-binding protein
LLLLAVTQAVLASTPVLDRIQSTGTITIAFRQSAMPFSYVDESQRAVGYSVEICQKLVSAVQRRLKMSRLKIKYLPVTSSNRLAMISEGKGDMECGSTTNNAERRKQVSFTIPHFFAGVRMLVRANSGIRSIEDLRGRRVVSTKGTMPLKLIAEQNQFRMLKATLLEGKDHFQSMSLVEKGEADAFVMDDVLLYVLRANAMQPHLYEIVGDPLTVEPYAIMVSKDDEQYKKMIDAELSALILNGELDRLYDKWFMRPIPPKGVILNAPMSRILRSSFRFPTASVAD